MSIILGIMLVLWPLVVWADGCTSITVMTPEGMKFCQSCCYGGSCQVSCF